MRIQIWKAYAIALITMGAMAGCSTASVRVMPGADGNHKVVSRDIERDDAEEEAIEAAEDYCKDRGQTAVFAKEETKYEGSMDEQTRKTVRTASKAGMILGGAGALGGSRTQGAGAVLGTAGMVGYGVTSDRDYKSEVQFRCQ